MSANAIKAGRAYVEIFTEDSKLVRGLRAAQARLSGWGKAVAGIGLKIFAGGAALTGPLLGVAKVFADAGSLLDDASMRTGVAVEALSELSYAAAVSGTTFEDVETGIRMMQKTIGGGGKKLEELANGLALNIGKLKAMKPEDQFLAIAEQISKITDPTKRAAMAMRAFGKQGANLLPMIDSGAKGIAELRKQARELGLVMSAKDAKAAAEFGDTLDVLWAQLRRGSELIGAVVAPALTTFMKWTQPIVAQVFGWIDANRPLLANLAAIAASVAFVGAGIFGMGVTMQATGFAISPFIDTLMALEGTIRFVWGAGRKLFSVLGTPAVVIFRALQAAAIQLGVAFVALVKGGIAAFSGGIASAGSAFLAMLTPIGVIGFALAGIGGYAIYASGTFQTLWSEGKAALGALVSIAGESWSAIGNALAKGDIAAAAAVLWSALQLAWVQGIRPLQMAWWTFKNFFQQVWANAVWNTASVFVNAWAGIKSTWTSTMSFMGQGWVAFTGMLQKVWHSAIGFIKKAWVRLKGVFGADVNVEQEVKRINDETAAKNAGVDADAAGTIDALESQRKSDLQGIEEQRKGTMDALNSSSSAELAGMQKEFDDKVSAADSNLQAARDKWSENVDAANAEAQDSPDSRKREGLIAKASKTDKGAKEKVNTALELGSNEALKAIVGAMDPEEKRLKDVADATKRTAAATEKQAAETVKLNRKLDKPVLLLAEDV